MPRQFDCALAKIAVQVWTAENLHDEKRADQARDKNAPDGEAQSHCWVWNSHAQQHYHRGHEWYCERRESPQVRAAWKDFEPMIGLNDSPVRAMGNERGVLWRASHSRIDWAN